MKLDGESSLKITTLFIFYQALSFLFYLTPNEPGLNGLNGLNGLSGLTDE
jgi:hypothetical protein